MSMCISAGPGEIAPRVLLTSDPALVRRTARRCLDGAACVSNVRNMPAYTGSYRGKRVTIQGAGLGGVSMAIYASELAESYGVHTLISADYCAGLAPEAAPGALVLAQAAHTASPMNRLLFDGRIFAATADWALLDGAYEAARARGMDPLAGSVLSLETMEDDGMAQAFARRGTLAADLSTSALYLCAGRFQARALSLLTVARSEASGQACPAGALEDAADKMLDLALDLL